MEAIRGAIELIQAQIAPSIEPAEHAKRRVIYNGIAVGVFVALEDFIRARTREVLDKIGTFGVPFLSLPQGLQSQSTVNVIGALSFRLRHRADQITYAQAIARQIASTAGDTFELPELTFGFQESNLSGSRIKDFLDCMHINTPWETVCRLATRAGVGAVIGKGARAFQDLADRRHRAAHDPEANIQPTDLHSTVLDAQGIALGYDCCISLAGSLIRQDDRAYLGGLRKASEKEITFVFCDETQSEGFKVTKEGRKRALRKSLQQREALEVARRTASGVGQFLVRRDRQSIPFRWEYSWFA